ncbi:hypothetical protein EVAR_41410_1 [Eumeta japonica]|uniref:Uncharacterized protein n=1 Tax=Eumeta variegata TaxID=151549 RepID=A0A4C1W7H8_EUMVA|nr:hypothetical protein EVAR_41410_1 [Eumeta japonica]
MICVLYYLTKEAYPPVILLVSGLGACRLASGTAQYELWTADDRRHWGADSSRSHLALKTAEQAAYWICGKTYWLIRLLSEFEPGNS